MSLVNVRELRDHGGDVLVRVARGETLTVTSDGAEVAELRPLPRRTLSTSELIKHRRMLPAVDTDLMRSEIAELIDPTLRARTLESCSTPRQSFCSPASPNPSRCPKNCSSAPSPSRS